ncbi:MAG: hypothetical protein RQ748_07090, partial [Elusimicrobiales bacterium]|nr:hypothetical protein [Elusimicrobiales bacterium]
MNITVIDPENSLAERAGEILLSARSLPDNIVVFPGKRPGHFLRKHLADKKGAALRAPVITSMDGFVDLAAEELGIKGTEASALDLAELLHSRLKKELCGVISREPADLPLDSFLPWALKLTGDFEELKIELKTPKDLSAYDDILPEDLRNASFIKKLESFSRLYADFYAEAGKAGLLTRSMKYAMVAERIDGFEAGKYENIIFAGLFAVTAAERTILKSLASRGARLLLEPGPGLEEQFSFLGKVEQSVRGHHAEWCPPLMPRFYKAADLHGEVFALARALKDPSAGDVIVLPEPRALFPVLENVLPAAGEYNISMGYPLAATPVYALLDALGDLLEKRADAGYFTPDYLKFVFHPYVKNVYLGGAAEPGRIIFQAVEERLSERMDKYIPLADIENDESILAAAAARLR